MLGEKIKGVCSYQHDSHRLSLNVLAFWADFLGFFFSIFLFAEICGGFFSIILA